MLGAMPVYVDGKPMRTENFTSITGKHWVLWRFGGRLGREALIRAWARFFQMTPDKLAEFPTAVRFPNGQAYRILDVDGRHEPI